MKCSGAMCAVLVVETGKGDGNYRHNSPAVHGLWLQTGSHGDSIPIYNPHPSHQTPDAPENCDEYKDTSFAAHEWGKHGKDVETQPDRFLKKVCDLAAPIKNSMSEQTEAPNG